MHLFHHSARRTINRFLPQSDDFINQGWKITLRICLQVYGEPVPTSGLRYLGNHTEVSVALLRL